MRRLSGIAAVVALTAGCASTADNGSDETMGDASGAARAVGSSPVTTVPPVATEAPGVTDAPVTTDTPEGATTPGATIAPDAGSASSTPATDDDVVASTAPSAVREGPDPSFVETFDAPDGLVTNEFAHWNPERPEIVSSPLWDVTSGSLFTRDGVGWTGRPDHAPSGPTSEGGTGSAVFRALVGVDIDRNVSVRLQLRVVSYLDDAESEDWDGPHLLLRYEDEARLYAVSVARRDGDLAIKRKLPGGGANEGHYLTVATAPSPVEIGRWHDVVATVSDVPDGVEIALWIDGALAISAVDDGTEGEVVAGPGVVGLRGDNVELEFDDLTITSLEIDTSLE